MSVASLDWAFAQAGLSPEEKLVLIWLANAADHEDDANISPDLAGFCGVSMGEVRECIAGLWRAGLLDVLDSRVRLLRPGARAPVWDERRRIVFERDGFRCVYCGCSDALELTLDHVMPKSRGGSDKAENLTTACRTCNGSKGARTPDEWRAV